MPRLCEDLGGCGAGLAAMDAAQVQSFMHTQAQLATTLQGITAALAKLQNGINANPIAEKLTGTMHKHILDDKMFIRFDKFEGGEDRYMEWAFDLKMAVGAKTKKGRRALEKVEELGEKTIMELLAADAEGHANNEYEGLETFSEELFQQLVLITGGDAKVVVKSVIEQDGIKAWGRLYGKYNQKTMGRTLRMHRECLNPRAVTSMEQVESAIMTWEEKWRKMLRESGGEGIRIPDRWKMAAMMEILPKELVDQVYVHIDHIGEKYDVLRDKVLTWVTNKVEVAKSHIVPMEVDEVKYFEGEVGIDAVTMQTKCFCCGGFGHMASNCGTEKPGGAKASKGKGKAKGKDGGFYGNNDYYAKGKGKGKMGFALGKGKKGKAKGFPGS